MRYFQRFHTAGSPEDDHAEINLSPLVDMVFLLLIFFMVTTSFVSENGIKVNRPEAATATPQAKEALQIALTAQNRIFVFKRIKNVAISDIGGFNTNAERLQRFRKP